MTLEDFQKSVNEKQKPEGINNLLISLWEERTGNWDEAHNISQGEKTADGALVHAYLHRREGDESNARYWYDRANSSFPDYDMDQEWEILVKRFLN